MMIFGVGVPAFTLLHQERFGPLVAAETSLSRNCTALGEGSQSPPWTIWPTSISPGAEDASLKTIGTELTRPSR